MSRSIEDVKQHVASCDICGRANKRVNDFCQIGKVVFYEFAQHNKPLSATVLSEQESARIIEKAAKQRKEAHNN